MTSGVLHKYFLSNTGRCIHKCGHYFDIYERHLSRFVGKQVTMLEIGVGLGGSLQMWKSYFGKNSKIIGLDIRPETKKFEEEQIEIFIGSQDDPKVIEWILTEYPYIDIVLDDGSHKMHDMVKSFELLYDRISPFGVYIVEDTHTCYWDIYEGGLKRKGSFIEFTKDAIDRLNAMHTKGEIPVDKFTKYTDSITCYTSSVVFDRRPKGRIVGIETGEK